MKFKTGDKVKLINTYHPAKAGATGVVKNYSPDGIWVRVIWDRNGLDNGINDDGFDEDMFMLVTESPVLIDIINSCPRCNGKLVKKEAEEPFTGKKYMIDKCQACGWC